MTVGKLAGNMTVRKPGNMTVGKLVGNFEGLISKSDPTVIDKKLKSAPDPSQSKMKNLQTSNIKTLIQSKIPTHLPSGIHNNRNRK